MKSNNNNINEESLPKLTEAESKEIKRIMKDLLKAVPEDKWPIAGAIDVSFFSGDYRTIVFTLSTPVSPTAPNSMRFTVPIEKRTVVDAAKRGQGAIWDWLRDASVNICVEAVSMNLSMPDIIVLQMKDVVRSHPVYQDEAFRNQLIKAAQVMAMSHSSQSINE